MIAEPITQTRYISADEFWEISQLPENRGKHLELVEGVIAEMAGGTSGLHGETSMQIAWVMGNHVIPLNLGRMTLAETGYILFKNPNGRDVVRQPDLAFISIERAPQPLETGYVPFAPDLAIEIVSPGNEADEIHDKVLDYLRYGVRLVWVFYPNSQTMVVHTKTMSKILMPEDRLDGSEVLPGFSVIVRDLFPK